VDPDPRTDADPDTQYWLQCLKRFPCPGLYFTLRKYNLPYPEAVFSGSYFKQVRVANFTAKHLILCFLSDIGKISGYFVYKKNLERCLFLPHPVL
jgi:hypothetical protein